MRIRDLSIPLLGAALAACQATPQQESAAPAPHAKIATSHIDAGADRVDTFRVTTVDGRQVGTYSDEPAKTIGQDTSVEIAAGRPVRVGIEGLARYRNPVKTLFWSALRVEGGVDFVAPAGAQYVVRGDIGPAGSAVWIEDAQTHEVVVRKFVAPAQGAAATP